MGPWRRTSSRPSSAATSRGMMPADWNASRMTGARVVVAIGVRYGDDETVRALVAGRLLNQLGDGFYQAFLVAQLVFLDPEKQGTALGIAKAHGAKRAILLPVSAPFHCSLMQPAAAVMAEALPELAAAFAPPAPPLCEDTPVCFTNQSTDATSYLWEFGDPDANDSTETSPCFAYSAPGTYTVFIDLKPNNWTLIISSWEAQTRYDPNNKTQLWGAYGYTPAKDVASESSVSM